VGVSTGLVTSADGATASQIAVITATSGALTASSTITLTAATSTVFDLTTVSDPLAIQQWALLNTGQTGYADTSGVANLGGTLGTDINVNPVYTTDGFTGKNVIVAVVDSGMEIAHEDLSANVVTGGSWNFINSTTDPTNTTATTGDHGTMVSGLIAMARNGIGGIGVAPNAQIKGFNYLGSSSTQTFANGVAALGGSSANPNSSDVAIFNQSFGTSNTTDFLMNSTVEAQYASGTSTLRGGKGAIYVKSAGNGFKSFAFSGTTEADGCNTTGGANSVGVSCQNANFDPSNTLPYNIVMAALNAKGKKSSYSTAGSAIWASAPGGEYGFNSAAITQAGYVAPAAGNAIYDPAMVTTDQSGCANGESVSTTPTGSGPFSFFNWGGTNLASINLNCNYTNGMNGTSSAAPMMSGSIALILEAKPVLTWREVKDILAKTAVQVDAGILPINITSGMTGASVGTPYVAEQGWITNAAGFKFHNWYGFGAVNVSAAVTMAKAYTTGLLGTFANTGWISSGALTSAIPDNSTTGVSVPLSVTTVGTGGIVEEVQLKVTTTNTLSGYTGDIGIELTSPSGTKSILKTIKDGFTGGNFAGMVLESNAFYGEASNGTWTAKVVDGWAGGTQTLTNVQIRVYGH
jgi:subtilisin family serine protease/subtilisin-like proprotein convertase family protein